MSNYVPSHRLSNEEWEALSDPLDVGDVANILSKSRRWVQEHTKAGLIPHNRVGRTYRYNKSDIFEFAGLADRTDAAPTIKVKLDEGAFLPERAHDTDAGADIRTPMRFVLHARSSHVVHTGVHIETPAGCAAMLKSKSGLNVRDGIVSEGVIDEGFTGEVLVKLYNHSDKAYLFERGDKITQVVMVPVLYPTYEQVEEIGGGERGDNGYGSTGR